MSTPIRIGIVGYGNLGRGVETALGLSPDMELVGVFTRRDPQGVDTVGAQAFPMSDLDRDRDDIDVLILCGGSRSDLPEQSPAQAARYSIVDSYDNHARIPEHFAAVDAAAKAGGTTAVISTGWDPGLFSLNRVYGEAIVPQGSTYTFWGRGLSQGHSDAVRRVPGVAAGVQYTLPSEPAIERVRAGENPELSTRERHTRECFVVLEEGADAETVRNEIVTMPDYFEPYDTTVHFITAEELARDHQGMPHGGFVIRSGTTSEGTKQVIEYRLALESNPEFTASVLVAYARAAARMNRAGDVGAKTVYDVAPGLLSPLSPEELRAGYL
ncbi:diaminopimelate dehydrogenase [Gordonia sp. (in: high G+C Gram-positive bacteria)]|uniref:diaminopimelate dehydrogenase n=1 Tax=Gordonia sp. (in: high G+C Gram-positive bacteria) TaxID=84139 RepID=UPI0016B0022B|nr:diaminopimelate dehydrogenase [Gordonia sp. (in: high G+C Gram-positive bacteria)]NLG47769.1 diaminopimelate dehydrogenase [Gordonia sp. (in: high G+C Gram-positive bacteria)]